MAEAANQVPVGLTGAEMERLRGLVDHIEGMAEEGVEAAMREFMEEEGGVEQNPVLKEEDALYARRREVVDRREKVVQSKRCKALLKQAQNWEKKRWKLSEEMEGLKYEKQWLTLERFDMRKLADRVRKRRVKREEKMRLLRLQMEVVKRVKESYKARRVQGNLVDVSAGAVVAFDVVVEEVEGGLGANYGEELLREVKGKVEDLRETVRGAFK